MPQTGAKTTERCRATPVGHTIGAAWQPSAPLRTDPVNERTDRTPGAAGDGGGGPGLARARPAVRVPVTVVTLPVTRTVGPDRCAAGPDDLSCAVAWYDGTAPA